MNEKSIGFEELKEIIFSELKPRLEKNEGLSIFAREISKFEKWLQVELIDILLKKNVFDGKNIFPEKDTRVLPHNESYIAGSSKKEKNFDIYISPDWLIELKTVNTNFTNGLPVNQHKSRPLPGNVKGVIKDIKSLLSVNVKYKSILFVVFPLPKNEPKWNKYLERIKDAGVNPENRPFTFLGNIPGSIYFGLI